MITEVQLQSTRVSESLSRLSLCLSTRLSSAPLIMHSYGLSPRSLLAICMSLGMMVTRLAWIAHILVSSKRPTRYASAASWRAPMASDVNLGVKGGLGHTSIGCAGQGASFTIGMLLEGSAEISRIYRYHVREWHARRRRDLCKHL